MVYLTVPGYRRGFGTGTEQFRLLRTYHAPGSITARPLGSESLAGPGGGRVDNLGRITTSGQVSEFPIP